MQLSYEENNVIVQATNLRRVMYASSSVAGCETDPRLVVIVIGLAGSGGGFPLSARLAIECATARGRLKA